MASEAPNLNCAKQWQSQGCAFCAEEQYQAAIAAFDCALSALHRPAEALACYDKATCLNPRYHQAWFNRGLLLTEMGAYGSAVAAYPSFVNFMRENLRSPHFVAGITNF